MGRQYLRYHPYSRYRLARQTLLKTAERMLILALGVVFIINENPLPQPHSAQFRLHEQMARAGAFEPRPLPEVTRTQRALALAAIRVRE